MKNNNLKGTLILTVAAIIWGLAFVAQSGAAALVPPFAFNALRSIIGAVVLYAFWLISGKNTPKNFFPKNKTDKKSYYICALVCGLCLSVAINFQQFGIAAYPKGVASEARAGFITALYVILVPIFSIFLKKKVGFYIGDFLIFLCAISFALHIMAVDKFVGLTGGVKLSIMQFLVAAVVSALLAIIFEFNEILLSNILAAAPQILYLGVMSSGVAYTLQIVGQKYAEPTVASITMSLESVFAALGGWLISGNSLSTKELIGCVLVFAAIVVAQMPQKAKR